MVKLIAQRDINTGFRWIMKGDEIAYHPWHYEYQGISEPERIAQGIYVHCFGHGEFEVLQSPEDVKRKLVNDSRTI